MKKLDSPLYVTSPLLPNLDNYIQYLKKIWESKYVTNNGLMVQKLEEELKELLNVPVAETINNGTIALMIALKMFKLKENSEVITTPMTFAATPHSITWNGLKPVFVDVKKDNLTIDPEAVEKAITKNTSAILAVHVYGSICDYKALEDIAKRYNLKLIFDAAHAFYAKIDNKSVASLGDASIFSFHATKLFNTIEGGLIASKYKDLENDIKLWKNFGIKNEDEVVLPGINGKMNELQAAIGLLNLKIFKKELIKRRKLRKEYDSFLKNLPGIKVQPNMSNFEIQNSIIH
jgi:dTDP-4-amino-4,6-dideoxygalactose transaminase